MYTPKYKYLVLHVATSGWRQLNVTVYNLVLYIVRVNRLFSAAVKDI